MDADMRYLVLASSSKARHRVLKDASVAHRVVPSHVSEDFDGLDASEAVQVLARRKAREVAARLPEELVLGCDSMLQHGSRIYGKPRDDDDARQMWTRLAGTEATLWTGHTLIDGSQAREVERTVGTTVRFGEPLPDELDAYLRYGNATELAGAFSIEGMGAPFLRGIDGEPSNVMGLSLSSLREMLGELGCRLDAFGMLGNEIVIRSIETSDDRRWLSDLVASEWGLPIVSVSGTYDPAELPGLLAESKGRRLGAACFHAGADGLEVVLLHSLVEGVGVGSTLLEAVRQITPPGHRLWLITTDDNVPAIGFYFSRGMRLLRVHRNFVASMGTTKPQLLSPPAFNDAFEFEYEAPVRPA